MNKFTKKQKQCRYFSKISKIFALLLVVMLPLGAMAENSANLNSETSLVQTLQTSKITLKMNNSSLEDILISICKQANVQYIVKNGVVLSGNKSIDVKDTTVEGTLDELLASTKYDYTIGRDKILIVERAEERISPSQPGNQTETVDVNGIVVDEKNKPIVGATVIVEGTSIGAITDAKGAFFVRTAIESKLLVSFIGMVPQSIEVTKENPKLTIKLLPDELAVEDVIVTGYGNVKKESFTGSATTVMQEELLKVSPTNVLEALAVFDPSLRIVVNNDMGSDPNTMPEMQIRGQSSISGTSQLDELTGSTSEYDLTTNSNSPVFILDGAEVEMTVIYDMDPTRIKSMTILKDAASTAIYGSRATNGVIVVESVAPEAGKIRVSYSFTGSVTAPDVSSYSLLTAQDKLDAEIAGGLLLAASNTESSASYQYRMDHYRATQNAINEGVDTYWLTYPLCVQFNQKHSLSLDGGSQDLLFSLDLSYSNNNGVMKDSFRDTYSAGFNINYKPNAKLRITNKVSVTFNGTKDSPYGSFSDYTSQQPYWSPYDTESGELVYSFRSVTSETNANPLYTATLESYDITDYFYFSENLGIDYFFNTNLRFTAQFAATYKNATAEVYVDPADVNEMNDVVESRGSLTLNNTENVTWNTNIVLQYNKAFGKHNINGRFGGNMKETLAESLTLKYEGFLSNLLVSPMFAAGLSTDPTISDSNSRLASAFLAANYSYNNVYLFDVSTRIDGSSQFGSNNRYAPFWSFGTGINIHNYDFMKEYSNTIDLLRLTANFGQTGNVSFSSYQAVNTYNVITTGWYPTGIGATLIARGNEDLTWEKTNALNVAFDGSFLNKRITVGLAYYNKTTNDLLSDVTIPVSTGFTTYKDNIGKIRNVGYEFDISYAIIKQKDMGLTATINGSKNVGTILEISDSQKAYNDAVIAYFESSSASGVNNTPILQYYEGGSLTSIYGVQSLGISPSTGDELYLTTSGNATTEWSASDQVIIGDTEPDLMGAARLSFFYKQLSVYASFIYSIGGDVYNSTLANRIEGIDILKSNVDERVLTDRWQEVGDVAAYTKISLTKTSVNPTSRFVQRENYFELNSISCSYSLKREDLKKYGISMCRFSVSMNDIFTISSIGQERGLSYPFARTVSFSANVSF